MCRDPSHHTWECLLRPALHVQPHQPMEFACRSRASPCAFSSEIQRASQKDTEQRSAAVILSARPGPPLKPPAPSANKASSTPPHRSPWMRGAPEQPARAPACPQPAPLRAPQPLPPPRPRTGESCSFCRPAGPSQPPAAPSAPGAGGAPDRPFFSAEPGGSAPATPPTPCSILLHHNLRSMGITFPCEDPLPNLTPPHYLNLTPLP
ncbi:unnamed protein product [Gadus morhua 'NCC']